MIDFSSPSSTLPVQEDKHGFLTNDGTRKELYPSSGPQPLDHTNQSFNGKELVAASTSHLSIPQASAGIPSHLHALLQGANPRTSTMAPPGSGSVFGIRTFNNPNAFWAAGRASQYTTASLSAAEDRSAKGSAFPYQ